MNIPAAIRCINSARFRNGEGSHAAHVEIESLLKEAVTALQPQRYVLYDAARVLCIVDTQHPDYREGANPNMHDPWVVLVWISPGEVETEKARAIVELLNTATHDNTK